MSDDDPSRIDTVIAPGDDHAPRLRHASEVRRHLKRQGRTDVWRSVAIMLTLFIVIYLAAMTTIAQRSEATVRENTVSFAQQALEACEDTTMRSELLKLDICQQAEDIVEDPDNPMPTSSPVPGPTGAPGADAPPPSDEQVAKVLQDLLPEQVPPAVTNYFAENPVTVEGMTEDEIRALLAGLVPTAEEVAALVPAGEDGTDGTDGTNGRGISSVVIRDCILIITFTDGTSQAAGRVCPGRSDQ